PPPQLRVSNGRLVNILRMAVAASRHRSGKCFASGWINPRMHSARGCGMTDVFISYKAEDRPRVRPLVEALEAEGLAVWWDARVGGGEAWRESIEQQLDAARCVIVVWSKRSTGPEGRFVRDEASRATRRRTYLPVRIDKVEPPLGFGETQALNLSGWKGDRSDPRY